MPFNGTAVTRHFVEVAGRLVHLRRVGRGSPVVLLHPSPMSSRVMLPAALALAERHDCFLLDTPGYGLSEPLGPRIRDLRPYVAWLADTLDRLGLHRPAIYGQATGAQIGIAFAKQFPARVAALVLDAAALFSPSEIEAWLPRYLPPLRPKPDGSHLASVWTAARDMSVFFPWMERTTAARLSRAVPPAASVHEMVLDYLRAGDGYRTAYAAAFRHEVPGALDGLRVPTSVIAWSQSSIAHYTARLVAAPGSAQVVRVDGDVHAKHRAVLALLDRARIDDEPQRPSAPQPSHRRLLPTRAGFLQVRIHGHDTDRAVLRLHPLFASTRVTGAAGHGRAHGALVVEPDLPGHGDSDGVLASHDDAAAGLEDVLDVLDLRNVTVTADWSTRRTAQALAARSGRRVVELKVAPRPDWNEDELAALQASPLPDLTPRDDGTHLLAAWHYIRDRELFSAWCRRGPPGIRKDGDLSTPSLHRRTVELLKVRGEREAALRAALDDRAGDLGRDRAKPSPGARRQEC